MSSTIIAVWINLAVQLLPLIGVNVGPEELTSTVQVLVAVVSGIWIWYNRTLLKKVGKAESDVNLAGLKK